MTYVFWPQRWSPGAREPRGLRKEDGGIDRTLVIGKLIKEPALFHVPGAGAVLFQATTANLNPWTEVIPKRAHALRSTTAGREVADTALAS
jgi:hypothetical protein